MRGPAFLPKRNLPMASAPRVNREFDDEELDPSAVSMGLGGVGNLGWISRTRISATTEDSDMEKEMDRFDGNDVSMSC